MQVIWTAAALVDRDAIYSYIEARNPRAALILDREFDKKTQLLAQHPYLGRPSATPQMRELIIHPNYILFYTVTSTHISVAHIKHVAQQPR